jgi:hypothetical protein
MRLFYSVSRTCLAVRSPVAGTVCTHIVPSGAAVVNDNVIPGMGVRRRTGRLHLPMETSAVAQS